MPYIIEKKILGLLLISCVTLLIFFMIQYADKNELNKPNLQYEDLKKDIGTKDKYNGIILSELKIEAMLNKTLKGYPMHNISLLIKGDDTISLKGHVNKDELKKYFNEKGYGILPEFEVILSLFPEKFNIETIFYITTEPESGLLMMTPETIKADGKMISDSLFPIIFFEDINDALNSALCGCGTLFSKIYLINGGIKLVA